MFRSRIKETLGADSVLFSKSFEGASEIINSQTIDEVIIDLNLKNDPIQIIRSLKASYPSLNIISFGSHVDTEKLAASEEAGATETLANSGMVKWLEARRV